MKKKYAYPCWQPKPLTVRIPSWLGSVAGICQPHALDEERMMVVLHQFYLSYLKNAKLRRSKKGNNFLPGYFPVASALLRQVGTNSYHRYVEAIIAAGVVEKLVNQNGRQSYLAGGHSQLYRWKLPPTNVGLPTFRTEKVTGYKVVKSVLRTRDRYAKENDRKTLEWAKVNPVYRHLLACLNEVEFDAGFAGSGNHVTGDLKYLEAEAFANGDLAWFVRDEFGHRLHHPVASLPKEYRHRLRFKGHPNEPLVVLDIKNSQPYFSSIIQSEHLIRTYLPEFLPLLPVLKQYERKADFLLYRQLCCEGRIYEYLMAGLGYDTGNKQMRDKVKELLFSAVLFSRLRIYGDQSRFRDLFRSVFPSVFEMFQLIKRLDVDVLPQLKEVIRPASAKYKHFKSTGSYRLVSSMMQRAEASLVYDVICPTLINEGIKVITIHDSFMVLPQDAEQARQIIVESFTATGLPAPTLSTK